MAAQRTAVPAARRRKRPPTPVPAERFGQDAVEAGEIAGTGAGFGRHYRLARPAAAETRPDGPAPS